MTTGIIAGLTGLGVAGIIGERLLGVCGKSELGSFVGIATYSELAITAIAGVIKLIQVITKIG